MHILALLTFSDFCLIVDLKKIKSWENLLSDIAKYPPIFSPYFIFLECITFFLTQVLHLWMFEMVCTYILCTIFIIYFEFKR